MATKNYNTRRKQETTVSSDYEIFGWVLAIVSTFILLCIVFPIILGAISTIIYGFMISVLGIFSYPFFVALLVLGIFMIKGRQLSVSKIVVACVIAIALLIVMILQLALTIDIIDLSMGEYIGKLFNIGGEDIIVSAGGVVFGVIVHAIASTISSTFSFMIYGGLVIALMAYLVSRSVKNEAISEQIQETEQTQRDIEFIKGFVSPSEVQPVQDKSLFVQTLEYQDDYESAQGNFNDMQNFNDIAGEDERYNVPLNQENVQNVGENVNSSVNIFYNDKVDFQPYNTPHYNKESIFKSDNKQEFNTYSNEKQKSAHEFFYERSNIITPSPIVNQNTYSAPYISDNNGSASDHSAVNTQFNSTNAGSSNSVSSSDIVSGFKKPPKNVLFDNMTTGAQTQVVKNESVKETAKESVLPEVAQVPFKDISSRLVQNTIINGDELSEQLARRQSQDSNTSDNVTRAVNEPAVPEQKSEKSHTIYDGYRTYRREEPKIIIGDDVQKAAQETEVVVDTSKFIPYDINAKLKIQEEQAAQISAEQPKKTYDPSSPMSKMEDKYRYFNSPNITFMSTSEVYPNGNEPQKDKVQNEIRTANIKTNVVQQANEVSRIGTPRVETANIRAAQNAEDNNAEYSQEYDDNDDEIEVNFDQDVEMYDDNFDDANDYDIVGIPDEFDGEDYIQDIGIDEDNDLEITTIDEDFYADNADDNDELSGYDSEEDSFEIDIDIEEDIDNVDEYIVSDDVQENEETNEKLCDYDALTNSTAVDLSENRGEIVNDNTGYYTEKYDKPTDNLDFDAQIKREEIRKNAPKNTVSQKSTSKSNVVDGQIKIDEYMSEKATREIEAMPKPKKRRRPIKYNPPPITYLKEADNFDNGESDEDLQERANAIIDKLKEFKIDTRVLEITRGPAVTRFELEAAAGVQVKKIETYAADLSYALGGNKIRIETPIPGKRAIGIEVRNQAVDIVTLRDIIDSKEFMKAKKGVQLALGKNITGSNIVCELAEMPHILIAGSTGSGKSACLNSIIMSMLYRNSPDDVKLVLIDPKFVEFSRYKGLPHLLGEIITESKQALNAFKWLRSEMDRRYRLFSKYSVSKLDEFNDSDVVKSGEEDSIPSIVLIIDELAELMNSSDKKSLEENIISLAQKARAAGIYLILATQRPTTDVITGSIKTNLPSRIAFAVKSYVDSRTILDDGGAEALFGRGDMLYSPRGTDSHMRVQGAFVTNEEVTMAVDYVKEHNTGEPSEEFVAAINASDEQPKDGGGVEVAGDGLDPLLKMVLRMVIELGSASGSCIQRRFSVGYNRAARIMDQMESLNFIGSQCGSKPREVYITKEQFKERYGEDVND